MRAHGVAHLRRAFGKDITVAEQTDNMHQTLNMIQRRATIVGGAALALTVVGIAVSSTSQVLQSYLFAFLFFFGVSAGSMFLLTVQHLTSGVWGLMIRRFTEASTLVIPWMGLFFLPIAAGVGILYEWTNPAVIDRKSVV